MNAPAGPASGTPSPPLWREAVDPAERAVSPVTRTWEEMDTIGVADGRSSAGD